VSTIKSAAVTREPIAGVKVKPLRLVPDERGWLMEILRGDDTAVFTKFGQVYVSATYPGVVKAWHLHRRQVDNFACVAGMVKLVLVDTREDSPTLGAINEFFIGTQNPINLVKATMDGLVRLRRPEEVAELRGLTVAQVLGVQKANGAPASPPEGSDISAGPVAPPADETAEEQS